MAETESRNDLVAGEYEPPAIEVLGSTIEMTSEPIDGSLVLDGA